MTEYLIFARTFFMPAQITPYNTTQTSKRQQVEHMFDNIAPKYDFLNRMLSLGIDQIWRKKAINSLKEINPKIILDVATGTADLAFAALKLNPEQVIGVDISSQMLAVGQTKINQQQVANKISLQQADSINLPFEDNKFDAVTVAFGVRNFEHLQQGINQMYRVNKPGGKIAVLEFSNPKQFPFKQIFYCYFKFILPLWGNIISKHKTAYSYLPESVKHFPEGAEFAKYLSQAGYKNINISPLTFGICTLYTGIK